MIGHGALEHAFHEIAEAALQLEVVAPLVGEVEIGPPRLQHRLARCGEAKAAGASLEPAHPLGIFAAPSLHVPGVAIDLRKQEVAPSAALRSAGLAAAMRRNSSRASRTSPAPARNCAYAFSAFVLPGAVRVAAR